MALTVAIDGIPACGKTTVLNMMIPELKERGLRVEMVDIETTGHAPTLRAIARTYPLGHPSRIMLFWILRLQQYDVIQELKDKTDVIFADRFWGSTLAFDVCGNGVPQSILDWVGTHIQENPNLTLLFDAPIDVVKTRKEANTMKDRAFAERVQNGYRSLAQKFSWTTIDATQSPQKVKEDCMKIIESKLL